MKSNSPKGNGIKLVKRQRRSPCGPSSLLECILHSFIHFDKVMSYWKHTPYYLIPPYFLESHLYRNVTFAEIVRSFLKIIGKELQDKFLSQIMNVSPISLAGWKLTETIKIKQEQAGIKSHSLTICRLKRQIHGIIKYNTFFLQKADYCYIRSEICLSHFPMLLAKIITYCRNRKENQGSNRLTRASLTPHSFLQLPCVH